jgi:hypothetical protein
LVLTGITLPVHSLPALRIAACFYPISGIDRQRMRGVSVPAFVTPRL